jgi:hypothetical protein
MFVEGLPGCIAIDRATTILDGERNPGLHQLFLKATNAGYGDGPTVPHGALCDAQRKRITRRSPMPPEVLDWRGKF